MPVRGAISVAFLGALAALALAQLRVPADLESHSAFDTERAMVHLRFIASQPHPLGSPHHRALRAYLVEQFQSLGIEVELQDSVVPAGLLRGLPVEIVNIVARLRGTD